MSGSAPRSGAEAQVKYVYPGLHSCLTSQNPKGMPHAFAYIDDTEACYDQPQPSDLSAAEAVALYLSCSALQPPNVEASSHEQQQRTCVCCAAVYKFSFEDATPYDATDMVKPRWSALACVTCRGDADDDTCFFVCNECTRLSQEALVEAKRCIGGAFNISRDIHLKDIVAFTLFLRRIDDSIARAFTIFPAQVYFNTTIYQGTAASVDYVEALTIVNRARHPAMLSTKPTTSTPAAIIYTAFHTFFITQKALHTQIAARASVDAVAAIAKAAKTTARNAAAKAPPLGTSLQERKRQRDESVCSCRGYDMEVRFAESHRLNMSVAIDHIRAVLKTRD